MRNLKRSLRFLIMGVGLVAVVVLAGPPAEVANVSTGTDVDDIAIDVQTNTIYIIGNTILDVSFFDKIEPAEHKRVARCNLGEFGTINGTRGNRGLGINIAGDRLYVANYSADSVSVYDATKGELGANKVNPSPTDPSACEKEAKIASPSVRRPTGLVHNQFDNVNLKPRDQVLVTSPPEDALVVLDATKERKEKPEITVAKRIALKGCVGPGAVATDVSVAYVACRQSDNVVKVDLIAEAVVASAPTGRAPTDIVLVKGLGKAYTADTSSDTVTVINISGDMSSKQIKLCPPGLQTTQCLPVAVTATSNSKFVFVALSSDQSISVICARTDTELTKFRAVPKTGNRPIQSLTVSPNNRYLYVSEEGDGVRVFDLNPLYDEFGGAGKACG